MKIRLILQLYTDDGTRFFGEGPYRLLRGIHKLGSLRASAAQMGMAYSKAFHIVKRAEAVLGVQLIQRTIGGKNGGGSVLTAEAEVLLNRYEQYRDACTRTVEKLYLEYFSDLWQTTFAANRTEGLRQNNTD